MKDYRIAVKDGVDLEPLHPICFVALFECARIFHMHNFTCTVTSTSEQVQSRKTNSLHYTKPYCRAFDLRIWRIPTAWLPRIVEKLQRALNIVDEHFQVVLKPDHIHIELDFRS